MNDDLLTALTVSDPARRIDLSRIDDQAFAPLREGIPMTTRPTTTPPKRRGRKLALGTAVAVLAGGTAATAAYQHWYAGGALDGLTCMTTWQDPEGAGLDATGGPALTGDPVADCQRYQSEEGKPAIADPVAIDWHGQTVVVPRDQVPGSATALPPATGEEVRIRELQASLGDYVDGGNSRCFDKTSGPRFADAEVARLGLSGWQVKLMPDNRPYDDGPCGFFDVDVAAKQALFFPDRSGDPGRNSEAPAASSAAPAATPTPGAAETDSMSGSVVDLRDALRSGITEKCLSLAAAEQVAKSALGTGHHWPTTAVTDSSASCARVDLEAGGSLQVTIYGPASTKP